LGPVECGTARAGHGRPFEFAAFQEVARSVRRDVDHGDRIVAPNHRIGANAPSKASSRWPIVGTIE
jgi:hypothetical protein